MKLLHFSSKDGSLDSEYIVLTDDSESSYSDHGRPGYKLYTVADVEGDSLHRLPTERALYCRR